MPKPENSRNYSALPVSDIAELLGVTDRQVRNWIKDSSLPAKEDPRGRVLDWPTTLRWYVAYRIEQSGGTGGNRRAGSGPDVDEETFDQAILRRTRAEADLKELQLAKERAQVVAVEDVGRVMASANKSIQTQMLALASSLAVQLIGLDDRQRIFNLIDHAIRNALTNLASVDAVLESRQAQPDDDEAD